MWYKEEEMRQRKGALYILIGVMCLFVCGYGSWGAWERMEAKEKGKRMEVVVERTEIEKDLNGRKHKYAVFKVDGEERSVYVDNGTKCGDRIRVVCLDGRAYMESVVDGEGWGSVAGGVLFFGIGVWMVVRGIRVKGKGSE